MVLLALFVGPFIGKLEGERLAKGIGEGVARIGRPSTEARTCRRFKPARSANATVDQLPVTVALKPALARSHQGTNFKLAHFRLRRLFTNVHNPCTIVFPVPHGLKTPENAATAALKPKGPRMTIAARNATANVHHNNLLRALRDHDYALISSSLVAEEKKSGELLYRPGDNIAQVYFPCGPSLVSYLVTSVDGRDVETVLVGREGAVGGIVSSGHLPAYCMITVRSGGSFLKAPVSAIQDAKDKSVTFKRLFSRYADCLLAQIFQATACNAIHSIEQRTAKWILAAMDRTGNHVVPLTHDELASLMGVGRSYVSRVIQTFKADGILATSRGALTVRDEDRMRDRACQCNESVKEHFEIVLSGVYPDTQDAK